MFLIQWKLYAGIYHFKKPETINKDDSIGLLCVQIPLVPNWSGPNQGGGRTQGLFGGSPMGL